MSSRRTVEGFYQWEPAVEITADALNTVFLTQINGAEFRVCVPRLDERGGFPLAEPQMLFRRPPTYVHVDPENAWGEWRSWDDAADGNSLVRTVNIRRVRLVTQIDSEIDPHQAAYQLDQQLETWWVNVRAWIEVITGQDLSTLGDRRPLGPNTFHFFVDDGQGFMKPLAFRIPVPIPPQAPALTPYGFNLCLEKAAADEKPPTEWLFFRDARSLHHAGEGRRAVLDAATAAEIGITAWLDSHAPAGVLADLANRPKTLRPLSELYKNHGGPLPDNFADTVVTPRNDAAHRGRVLSETESRLAVETVKTLLSATTPLGIETA